MSARFAELDWRPTPMGAISLRRRRDPATGTEVYEVKLDDDFLMSSQFTEGEVALAELGLAQVSADEDRPARPAGQPDDGRPDDGLPGGERPGGDGGLDVVVGGLGLGHTAAAVLRDPRVRSLVVVETLGEVIEWHRRGMVPLGDELTSDPRCRLVQGDFFSMAGDAHGFDPDTANRVFDAILVDIDHSPQHVLIPQHSALYQPEGLRAVSARLRPGGVFGLWSDDPPHSQFTSALNTVFASAEAHVVTFDSAVREGGAANTVYVARAASTSGRDT